jgi:predicted dienelactone hydrolase
MIGARATLKGLLLAIAIGWIGEAAAQQAWRAGYGQIAIGSDPAIETSLWYPTPADEAPWDAGPFRMAATRGAPPAEGPHPLVLLSHGTGGSPFGHAELAATLARRGFIVAAPLHPFDNFRDTSGFGTDLQLLGRPRHIAAVLDGVLADPLFGPRIDAGRIGFVGYSAGGYTGLVAIGGEPDFDRLPAYCRDNPDDRWLCIMPREADRRREAMRRPDWRPVHEKRIKAAVLMAPAVAVAFERSALSRIDVPVLMMVAERDEVVLPRTTEKLHLAFGRPAEHVAFDAGHFAFLEPCGAQLAQSAPEICVDPPGVDRAAVQRRVRAETLGFLERTLGEGGK